MPTRPKTHAQLQAARRPPELRREVRGTAAQRGYDSKWQRARQEFLSRNPLCLYCQRQGRTAAATLVDHSRPPKGDMKLFWDRSLWAPCCDDCHQFVSARYDGGHGRLQRQRDGHYVSPVAGEVVL